ncbi:MAG: ethylbenzene dehydrogenase-related protein [Deltaproteobacteria bacterium]|nr:ethylbenzene dehydrogenase-related protein [Deltaproteobacteria bacterium]
MKRSLEGWMVLFLVTLAIVWGVAVLSHAQERKNFFIPKQLQTELKVKVTYNDTHVFFRFEWPSESKGYFHDYLRFKGGKWVKTSGSSVGPHPLKLYEDRVSFLLDDGSVRYFDSAGGYVTIHERMRFLSNQSPKAEVQKHPYLGIKKKKSDVRKYNPETRKSGRWEDVVSEAELKRLKKNGVFLDLWMWRAHRGNPIGAVDDLWIHEYRNGDKGKSAYTTNWDKKRMQPKFMYDIEKTGFHALKWEDVINYKLTQKDIYFLSHNIAKPFDPNHSWKEGDTLPRRYLRQPEGSRGDITGKGVWKDGSWHVDMRRLLNTGNDDDKQLQDERRYTIAFAVHKNYTGSRWHYISLPYKLGMGVEAELSAHKFQGAEPPWESIPWTRVPIFYPGQVTWEFLTSRSHAGATGLREGRSCADCHTPELLGAYAVEHELRDEIKNRWYLTIAGGAILLAGLAFSGVIVARKR